MKTTIPATAAKHEARKRETRSGEMRVWKNFSDQPLTISTLHQYYKFLFLRNPILEQLAYLPPMSLSFLNINITNKQKRLQQLTYTYKNICFNLSTQASSLSDPSYEGISLCILWLPLSQHRGKGLHTSWESSAPMREFYNQAKSFQHQPYNSTILNVFYGNLSFPKLLLWIQDD